MMNRPLTYSDYINDTAVIEALRVPQTAPAGIDPLTWPTWHAPGETGDGVEWAPGRPWPRGGNWAHDEVLFIRTHQAFEVWFALILHELDDVMHRARDICREHGAGLPRVELSERRAGAAHAAGDFPAMQREADSAGYEGIATRIRRMSTPARHATQTPIRLEWFTPVAFDLWSSRIHRATEALRGTLSFFDVLATMTPAQFLAFRGRLVPASGFGSIQFREIEMLAGLRELNLPKIRPPGGAAEARPGETALPEGMLRPTEATPPGIAANSFHRAVPPEGWPRLARRFADASLRDLIYALLSACPLASEASPRGANSAREVIDGFAARNLRESIRDWRQAGVEASEGAESLLTERIDELDELLSHRETIAAALVWMHEPAAPTSAALQRLIDASLRLDGTLLTWRDAHIRFVERMIGTRPGTGGGGVKYLRYTIDAARGAYMTHALPCLWQARSLVQKP